MNNPACSVKTSNLAQSAPHLFHFKVERAGGTTKIVAAYYEGCDGRARFYDVHRHLLAVFLDVVAIIRVGPVDVPDHDAQRIALEQAIKELTEQRDEARRASDSWYSRFIAANDVRVAVNNLAYGARFGSRARVLGKIEALTDTSK